MDKLTIATQVLLKLIETDKTGFDAEGIAAYSFEIADAMQAEADKREDKTRPEVLCEVDWRVAPEEANVYFKDGDNEPPKWFDRNNKLIGTAPDFGFSGYVCEYRPQ